MCFHLHYQRSCCSLLLWNKKTSKVVQFQVQIKVLDGYTKYLVRTSFSHVMQQGVSISEIGT